MSTSLTEEQLFQQFLTQLDHSALDKMTDEQLNTIQLGLKKLEPPKLNNYRPYAKQRLFHDSGREVRERLLRAGNQQGKTYAGAAEAAIHATGLYPDDWKGRRFDHPTLGWVGAETGELTRDNPQRLLLGEIGEEGTGLIPNDCLLSFSRARGVEGLVDRITVRHTSGKNSHIKLKNYEQGRQRWQSASVHWIWLDEEPDEKLYMEALTRTNATKGLIWLTFTPLLGMSEVVRRFIMEKSPDRADINMTIEDAEHIDPAERQKIIDSYPKHEKAARVSGKPSMGSGRIFPIDQEEVECKPLKEIPDHFKQLGGLDFGWDHPTAAVKGFYDPDEDVIYIASAYKKREATPLIHAGALKPWGKTLQWAWPADGLQHSKDSGETLAKQYEEEGLNMLAEHATFEDGGCGVEAGLMEMLDRMQTRRLRVYSHLTEWFDEFLIYHRKDGKVVKEFDDLMSATRYLMMMIRFADYVRPASPRRRSRHGLTAMSV